MQADIRASRTNTRAAQVGSGMIFHKRKSLIGVESGFLKPPARKTASKMSETVLVHLAAIGFNLLGLIAILVSVSAGLFVVGLIAVVFLTAFLLSGIFGPTPQYEISNKHQLPSNNSTEFLDLLESLVDAKVNRNGIVEVRERVGMRDESWYSHDD
jgi:hypothetical protein